MNRRVPPQPLVWRLVPRVGFLVAWMGCRVEAPTQAPPPAPPPLTIDARQATVKAELDALIGQLLAEDRYACCATAPCKWCALRTAGCSCGPGLQRGEPVCEECALMWTKGMGSVEGVDPDGVRSFLEAMREDPWCGRKPPEPLTPLR